jgi:hypothetical protein
MTKIEDALWLYDRAVYDDAVASGIIEDKYLTDWMENPNLDIDTIAKKPVRFMLCALGVREWRDTMLWRRAYEEGVTYSTPDLVTLSEMTSESLYDIFWHYVELDEAFADTAWGYHFQQEMILRENDYA